MIRSIQALVGVLAVALCAGCVTSRPGDNATHTLRRYFTSWETVVAAPIEKVYKASGAGVADLGLKPDTSAVDKLTGLVEGFMADGTRFEVRLSTLTDTQTRVRITIGMLGDYERATHLFRAIEKHL
jgi:hypothetical protein